MAPSETNQTNSDRDKSSARELFLKQIQLINNKDEETNFEKKKINDKIFAETIKAYYNSMISGVKGERLSNLKSNYPINSSNYEEKLR